MAVIEEKESVAEKELDLITGKRSWLSSLKDSYWSLKRGILIAWKMHLSMETCLSSVILFGKSRSPLEKVLCMTVENMKCRLRGSEGL